MWQWIKWILILGAVYLVALAAGVRFHPENLKDYQSLLPIKFGKPMQRVTLANGSTVVGTILEESADAIKFMMDGTEIVFSRAEVLTILPVSGKDLQNNSGVGSSFQAYRRPLVTCRKEDNFMTSWDSFVMEPSRIADDMRKKNPRIFSAGGISHEEQVRLGKAKRDFMLAQRSASSQQREFELSQ